MISCNDSICIPLLCTMQCNLLIMLMISVYIHSEYYHFFPLKWPKLLFAVFVVVVVLHNKPLSSCWMEIPVEDTITCERTISIYSAANQFDPQNQLNSHLFTIFSRCLRTNFHPIYSNQKPKSSNQKMHKISLILWILPLINIASNDEFDSTAVSFHGQSITTHSTLQQKHLATSDSDGDYKLGTDAKVFVSPFESVRNVILKHLFKLEKKSFIGLIIIPCKLFNGI